MKIEIHFLDYPLCERTRAKISCLLAIILKLTEKKAQSLHKLDVLNRKG